MLNSCIYKSPLTLWCLAHGQDAMGSSRGFMSMDSCMCAVRRFMLGCLSAAFRPHAIAFANVMVSVLVYCLCEMSSCNLRIDDCGRVGFENQQRMQRVDLDFAGIVKACQVSQTTKTPRSLIVWGIINRECQNRATV